MAERTFSISFHGATRTFFQLLGIGSGRSGVTVTPESVHVKMGWAFDGVIPRTQIVSAEKAKKPVMLGWGVHGWCGVWAVNGSDDGIVRLRIDPPIHARMLVFAIRPHELYISLDDPDGFLAALN